MATILRETGANDEREPADDQEPVAAGVERSSGGRVLIELPGERAGEPLALVRPQPPMLAATIGQEIERHREEFADELGIDVETRLDVDADRGELVETVLIELVGAELEARDIGNLEARRRA